MLIKCFTPKLSSSNTDIHACYALTQNGDWMTRLSCNWQSNNSVHNSAYIYIYPSDM